MAALLLPARLSALVFTGFAALALLLALAGARLLERFLYGIEAVAPLTFAAAAALLAAVGLLASWLPVRRAARLDPMRVLRVE